MKSIKKIKSNSIKLETFKKNQTKTLAVKISANFGTLNQ